MKLLLLSALLAVAACRPQLAAAYETTSHVSGPVTNMTTPVARVPETATDAPPSTTPHSFSAWVGGGGRYVSMDFGVHLHDVDSQAAMIAMTSLDLRFTIPFKNHVAFGGHVGPAAGMVLDRTSGEHAFGQGVRFGALVSANVGAFGVFADLYETEMVFFSGSAQGASKLTGLLVGIALR